MLTKAKRFAKAFQRAHIRPNPPEGAKFPPGILNMIGSHKSRDQEYLLRRTRRLGPVFKMWLHGDHTTCIVGHARARRFLSENEGHVPSVTVDLRPQVPDGSIRSMEGATHRQYRKLFLEAIQTTPIAVHEESVRAIIRDRLGECVEGRLGQAISMSDLSVTLRRIAGDIMLLMFFGLSRTDAEYAEIYELYEVLSKQGRARLKIAEKDAMARIEVLLAEFIARVDADPNYPECLLKCVRRKDALDANALGNLIHFVEPARFDTFCLWRWVVYYLSQNHFTDKIFAEFDQGPERKSAISEAAVLETFRLNQAELLLRMVDTDVVFDGFFIPKGTKIRVCIWEGHKDPDIFPEPFEFQLERFLRQSFTMNEYATFGLDKHRCIGASMAIDASRLLVEEMVEHYHCNQAEVGPPVLGKYHWEPNPKLTVIFERRTETTQSHEALKMLA